MSSFSLTCCFFMDWGSEIWNCTHFVGWRGSNQTKDLVHFLSYLLVWVLLLVWLLAGCILSLAFGLADSPFVSFYCMTFFRVYIRCSWRTFYYQDDLFSVYVCLAESGIRDRLNFLTVAKFCTCHDSGFMYLSIIIWSCGVHQNARYWVEAAACMCLCLFHSRCFRVLHCAISFFPGFK
jgi:hypothetical protein